MNLPGLLGAHVSIAGGLDQAPENGKRLGCECIQIFTRNQRQWKSRPLTSNEVTAFRSALRDSQVRQVVCHASYLINLASPEETTLRRSREALRDELIRCHQLGISCLIFHPGSHCESGEKAGLQRIAESLKLVLEQEKQATTRLLLETTAGQGTSLGYRFEQLAEILALVKEPDRVGICLDTCHLFAAGYDLRAPRAFKAMLKELETVIGASRVHSIHLNDSARELGSRVDRHAGLGKGYLGTETFRMVVQEEQFKEISMVLETPGGEEGYRRELTLLKTFRHSRTKRRKT
ncbi:MAG: deoxyribonuclease IV [Terriglobia bacterium]